MDLNTLKRLEKEYMKANGIKDSNYDKQGYDNIYVKVDDVDNVEAVEKAIQDYGYDTYSMSSERDRMREQSQMIQMILGGLGAVSLFVAALSIANTMTMAIYERTREIDVYKRQACGGAARGQGLSHLLMPVQGKKSPIPAATSLLPPDCLPPAGGGGRRCALAFFESAAACRDRLKTGFLKNL